MSQSDTKRYRVHYLAKDKGRLPEDIVVVEQYPAFGIVEGSESAIAALRRRYPVEPLSTPSPSPIVPTMASASAVGVKSSQRRPPYYQVIRFALPVQEQHLQQVAETTGCEIVEPIGSSTFVVRCRNQTIVKRIKQLDGLSYVRDFVPDIQLPTLAADSASTTLIASYFSGEDRKRSLGSLRRQGFRRLIPVSDEMLVINLTSSDDITNAVGVIAAQPGLRSLQEQQLNRAFNDIARRIIGDRVITTNPGGLGLTGRGEIVAITDSGLDTGDPATIHADFRGRIRDIQSFPIQPGWNDRVHNRGGDDGPADFSGHGTHVCGSALGDGAQAAALGLREIKGMAPEAGLVFQAVEQTTQWRNWEDRDNYGERALLGIPADLKELFQPAYDQGARIHSNSWGGGNSYDDQCTALDQFVWDHKDFLVVVAAGNEGTDEQGKGHIAEGSVTSPAIAKNCLTVGASKNERPEMKERFGARWPEKYPKNPLAGDIVADDPNDIAAFSGRGPCPPPGIGKPGRCKPDVVAPGTFILSVRSSQLPPNDFAWGAYVEPAKHDYMFMGGTSMATPLVAGAAAIVRQYLRETQGIANPSAALLKATLIHSAHYLDYRYKHPKSQRWADNEQGWGRIDLQQVLNPQPPVQVIFSDDREGFNASGQANELLVRITNSEAPLRLTLVYTDLPGKDLINNLNLIAWEPDEGRYYVGNDFGDGGIPDSANNVEGIVVENPVVGDWRILVSATAIPEGTQDFALVISGGGTVVQGQNRIRENV